MKHVAVINCHFCTGFDSTHEYSLFAKIKATGKVRYKHIDLFNTCGITFLKFDYLTRHMNNFL